MSPITSESRPLLSKMEVAMDIRCGYVAHRNEEIKKFRQARDKARVLFGDELHSREW
jgi:hypothetical protein